MQSQLPKFQYIEHTADVGIKVFAPSLEKLFENAAEGLFDIITDLSSVVSVCRKRIQIEAIDREALLVNWLSELNCLFLIERTIFKEFRVEELNENKLTARIAGEAIDFSKHEIYTEVKAVTYHKLYIKEIAQGWEAQVIFDL